MDTRLNQLEQWVFHSLPSNGEKWQIVTASADASFRRYFRVVQNTSSYIVMDAPPDREPIDLFLTVSKLLQSRDIHVPKIHYSDEELGFILMEDLGSTAYLDQLPENASQLYSDALVSLHKIQNTPSTRPTQDEANPGLPHYDSKAIQTELDVFEEWFLKHHLAREFSAQEKDIWNDLCLELIDVFNQQPQVWVHRDYHSRNLMVVPSRSPGVIDFQDMIVGPACYDLASLLKDCYIQWPRQKQLEWLEEYYRGINNTGQHQSFSQYVEWFDLTGLQRHLKVLGVFSRLHYRDGKSSYLSDLPTVYRYIEEVLALYPKHRAIAEFQSVFSEYQLPSLNNS